MEGLRKTKAERELEIKDRMEKKQREEKTIMQGRTHHRALRARAIRSPSPPPPYSPPLLSVNFANPITLTLLSRAVATDCKMAKSIYSVTMDSTGGEEKCVLIE